MTNDSRGEIGYDICLFDSASKGKSGRRIPLNAELRKALIEYRESVKHLVGPHVIRTERSSSTSPQAIVNMFQRWYRHLGFVGCSSHSGRRTFITNAARKISTVGGSLKDVQELAGHANLRTTQRYIDANPEAQGPCGEPGLGSSYFRSWGYSGPWVRPSPRSASDPTATWRGQCYAERAKSALLVTAWPAASRRTMLHGARTIREIANSWKQVTSVY